MQLEVLADAEQVARRGAAVIADAARESTSLRGRFNLAVSGGATPWRMLRLLNDEDIPWEAMHVFQVDERVAPDDSPDRNLTRLCKSLPVPSQLPPEQLHPMPVTGNDLDRATAEYARTLERVAGAPPVLDLVHLGLGTDGHTASLVPGDAVLEVRDRDVALTAHPYQGHRRMTLCFPALARARRILWLVAGADKAESVRRLRDGDASIPAGRVNSTNAQLLLDAAAAGR